MKWSDGAPFTADDIIFWYEDIYSNKEIQPASLPDLVINGKPITVEKVDNETVRFVSPEPNPLLIEIMASPISDLGATFRQPLGRGGPYAPKRYLSKFHAKYVGKDAADNLARQANQNGWVANIKLKMEWRSNLDLPVVYPWVVKTPATDPTSMVLERNPYSIWVDTDGNQLPYIGTIRKVNVQSTDVIALKTTAGELDFMELQYTPAQLPVLVQNADRGNYKVYLDPQQAGVGIALNLAYDEDPVLGELYRDADFRRALSMGIDRGQVNEVFFLGTEIPSSLVPTPDNKYYPGDEWRDKWAKLDVAAANALLDKIGLTQKDSAGFRLRKDGKRLTLTFMAVDRLVNQAQLGEMVKGFWQEIGVDLTVEAANTAIAQQRIQANQAQMTVNNAGSDEPYLSIGFHTPIGGGFSAIMGVPYGQWINSQGRQGKEPFAELKAAQALLDKGKLAATAEERIKIGKELIVMAADNVFGIGLVTGELTAGIRIAKNTMGNIPARFLNTNVLLTPVTAMAQTYYFK
ncbi:MAG: hypothetical protein FJ034_06425 [Chloroflexi bacterium]|nr:hypothetical protein [Chloroflexota bacterium]